MTHEKYHISSLPISNTVDVHSKSLSVAQVAMDTAAAMKNIMSEIKYWRAYA